MINTIQLPVNYGGVVVTLDELRELERSPIIKAALKSGGKYLVTGGKARLRARLKTKRSERTGLLLKSITYSLKKKNKGILWGFKRSKGGHAYLSGMINSGTDDRSTKKGYNRGSITATHFWDDTKDQDVPVVQKMVEIAIRIAVEKIRARKAAQKVLTGGIL